MSLEGRVAIVTGSTSGIGRAIADAFFREGANVVFNGSRRATVPELMARYSATEGRAIYVQADISRKEEVRALVQKTIDAFGRIDILVNNAARSPSSGIPVHEMAEDEWDAIVDVCLKGPFLCAKYALPELIKTGGGVIINIGSIEGLRGFAGDASYGAAKAGLMQLNRVMAVDYASHGIRVNIINPGFIATAVNERLREDPEFMKRALERPLIKRPGSAEEVAQLAVFLASDDAAYITGADFTIDGGWTVR